MKYFLLLLLPFFSFGYQEIPDMNPKLGYLVDKSPEGEIKFNKAKKTCDLLSQKVAQLDMHENLSAADQAIYNECDMYLGSYWNILGPGDNWYDGGKEDTLSASSQLASYKGITYAASNAHDLNYKTVWAEGVKGYGIGETLTYNFPPQTARVTDIIVVNGYVKSLKSWKENSRVKKLKMYLNDEPIAILNLKDSRQQQSFSFEPMGVSERDNYDELMNKPWWSIKFEIMEVYKGDKYDDTVITEIFLDGIDVY